MQAQQPPLACSAAHQATPTPPAKPSLPPVGQDRCMEDASSTDNHAADDAQQLSDTSPLPNTQYTAKHVLHVQGLIERCMQAYMSQAQVMRLLQARAHIHPSVTACVWAQLQARSPSFFALYQLRVELVQQVATFNCLLEQQVNMVQRLYTTACLNVPAATAPSAQAAPGPAWQATPSGQTPGPGPYSTQPQPAQGTSCAELQQQLHLAHASPHLPIRSPAGTTGRPVAAARQLPGSSPASPAGASASVHTTTPHLRAATSHDEQTATSSPQLPGSFLASLQPSSPGSAPDAVPSPMQCGRSECVLEDEDAQSTAGSCGAGCMDLEEHTADVSSHLLIPGP